MNKMPKEEFGVPGVIAYGSHPCNEIGGQQVIFRWKSDYGLSCVNSPMLHHYPFAWEVAVLKFKKEVKDARDFEIKYDTGLTENVEVFETVEETREFVQEAYRLLGGIEEGEER